MIVSVLVINVLEVFHYPHVVTELPALSNTDRWYLLNTYSFLLYFSNFTTFIFLVLEFIYVLMYLKRSLLLRSWFNHGFSFHVFSFLQIFYFTIIHACWLFYVSLFFFLTCIVRNVTQNFDLILISALSCISVASHQWSLWLCVIPPGWCMFPWQSGRTCIVGLTEAFWFFSNKVDTFYCYHTCFLYIIFSCGARIDLGNF